MRSASRPPGPPSLVDHQANTFRLEGTRVGAKFFIVYTLAGGSGVVVVVHV